MLLCKQFLISSTAILLALSSLHVARSDDLDDELIVEPAGDSSKPTSQLGGDNYATPKLEKYYLYEHFDDSVAFESRWIKSANPKYNGVWYVKSSPDRSQSDLQLVLATKARHHAISTKLDKPFLFDANKPLIVQYEVQYREGLDCGGSYVKLLRSPSSDLPKLDNETPYSIMFGPDKCGSDSKLHFIIQYKNPKTGKYEEKHWKSASKVSGLFGIFGDKKHHLVKLVVKPDNTFEIFLDDQSVGSGSLLEEFDPPINPAKEIVDVNDKKPADWDDRIKIEDPNAVKPDDWDEDAPKKIHDPSAQKPDDWLENEPELVADPEAKKPDDWDSEMDGEWEAPLVPNPKCKGVSGCGKWEAPMIANPAFKGKWRPPMIDNPAYKGFWEPRMIPNPDYYHDDNPFRSLTAIDALAFELWSMSDSIAFDNLLITDDAETAALLQSLTWQTKKILEIANEPSKVSQYLQYFHQYPWLWAVVVLAVGLPVCLFIAFCCVGGKKQASADEAAKRKKTDKSLPDTKPNVKNNDNEGEVEEEEEEEQEEQEQEDEDFE
ncbi:Calnexin, partial [Fragariocoptes setiger]